MNAFYEILLSIAFLILAMVLYVKYRYVYWERKGVYVSCKPTFLLGNSMPMLTGKCVLRDFFKDIYDKCQRDMQKISGFYFFLKPCLVITDLDLFKSIVSNDFEYFTGHMNLNHKSDPFTENIGFLKGDQWRNLRAQLSPAFTPAKTRMMFHTISKCTDKLIHVLKYNSNKQIVNISDIVEKYSVSVTASSIFGIECDSLNVPNTEFEYYLKKFYNKSTIDMLVTLLMYFQPDILSLVRVRSIRKDVAEYFLKLATDNVKYREENAVVRQDLVHFLTHLKNNVDIGAPQESNLKLSDINVAANCLIFAIGDYETTSSAISFCSYELSVNADIQHRARCEVIDLLEEHNGDLGFDAVNEMSYIEKCVKETLRKYSPTPVHFRECTKEYTIPNTNIIIEKGTLVFVPHHGFHMDPNIFPNPHQFDPQRFSKQNIAKRHPCSWTPFGYGPRMCIGTKHAIMKIKLCLAKLLLNFEFSVSRSTEIPIIIKPKAFITNSANGVWINVKKID